MDDEAMAGGQDGARAPSSTGSHSTPARRRLLGMGAAGALGAVAGALGGAFRTRSAAAERPWDVVPQLAHRSEIGRWEIRRHRPSATEVRWSAETDRRAVALTFDDGPDPDITPVVLDALDRHGAAATFFVVGALARQHPQLVREMVERGHEVANHTWSHPQMLTIDVPTTRRELDDTSALLEDLTGSAPRWFRPPRGQLTGEAIATAAMGSMGTVLWSQRFGGTEEVPAIHTVARLLDALDPGDVVLCHDGVGAAAVEAGSDNEVYKRTTRTADARALDALLGGLREEGWDLLTVSGLVGTDPAGTGSTSPGAAADPLS